MRKFINIIKHCSILSLGLMFVAPGCTDLDEEVFSQVTADNFFQSDDEFIAALGSAYSALSPLGGHANVWSCSELASDELVVTTKGGDWFDGGVLIEIHRHQFTPR